MSETRNDYPNPGLIADFAWLSQHLDDLDVRIIDVRTPMEYDVGHIRNAVNVPVNDIAMRLNGLPSMCVPREQFEGIMSEKGVDNNTTVVAYDSSGGLLAARFLWSLEYFGHLKFKIMDGSFSYWTRLGHDIVTDIPDVKPTKFMANPDRNRLADSEWILNHLKNADVTILDCRNPHEVVNPGPPGLRSGKVPGAAVLTWDESIERSTGTLKTSNLLVSRLKERGITPEKEVVTYCASGIRSAHSYIVLRILGYSRARNYDGSWYDWGSNTDLPVEF
ncbi:MAG: hypothetical protein CMO12_03280 [Thaumarchaeota archaeon]|nr:hypothetical protein [Nitrososphaerota archaeon]